MVGEVDIELARAVALDEKVLEQIGEVNQD